MSTPADPPRSAADAIPEALPDDGPKGEQPGTRRGAASLIGAVLGGRYRVERLIGEGGMGAVYKAQHIHMLKRVAIKVLHAEMSRMPEVVARFEREAMAAAHIDHPNVAAATDFGKLEDGSFFLVLEYVEGLSLRDVIAEGRLEMGRALAIARQMASALDRAHSIGIVHRDLKPENIMLINRDRQADFVKILDFGIAKVPVGELGSDHAKPGQPLTRLGMVYGTPEYMAPEQALGQPVDGRADLYGLGVILFEMIAGARPYRHESKVTLLGMHVTAPIPHLIETVPEARVPADVDALVARLLAKDASGRFDSAKELGESLDRAILALTQQLTQQGVTAEPQGPMPGGSPSVARRRPWAAWASAVGASVGVLVVANAVVRGPSARRDSAPTAAVSDAAPPPRSRDMQADEIVAAAQRNMAQGDFATAIEWLTGVERSSPRRADVHRLLERAFMGVRSPREAMRQAGLLLDIDPGAADSASLGEDIRNSAFYKETQDQAFSLLETKMGPRGIDILYDIAYGTSAKAYPQAAARAKRSIGADGVRARASPALSIVLDLRDAKSCEAKHALLDRARDHGDGRLLPTLAQYQTARGCGFLGMGDCFGCLRKDALLSETISAIEERAAKSP